MNQPPDFSVSAAELNRRFREVRDRAREGAVTITHHGKPTLALLDIDRFRAMTGGSEELRYARLAMIVDNLGDGFVAIDRDWCIRVVNHATEVFLGKSRQELVGKHYEDVFGNASEGRRQTQRAMDFGEAVTAERSSEIIDGRRISLTAFPMPAPYDGVGFFFANITEQETLRRNATANQAIVDTLFAAADHRLLLVVDGDGLVERVGGATQLLGPAADRAVGRPLDQLLADHGGLAMLHQASPPTALDEDMPGRRLLIYHAAD